MRRQLKAFLIKAKIIHPDKPAHVIPELSASPVPTDPVANVDSFGVGLRSARLEGWFNEANNSVYPGFTVSADDTVLDLGCGDGGIVSFCARANADIIIADIDSAKIETTRQKLESLPAKSVRALVTDAAPLQLEDAAASRIICTEVLEHVDDPVGVVAELVRVGKPGARYLVSVPDASAEHIQKPVAADIYYQKPYHVRIFSREEFRALLEDAGLIVESHELNSFYWALWWCFFWVSGPQDLGNPNPTYPLLVSWAQTWQLLLDAPNGPVLKRELDKHIAKSQVIVAYKPG